ncbi:MAG TPA: hypothetical protein VE548_00670 [Nitrososphaeraceae archaeon]|nr:hypothetical protein [Nitrososphaeraceae archaeon]
MKCSLITFILILSLSMSGVFASVSTPVISLYATTESSTDENEESPNTTDENVPETDDQPDNTLPEPQGGAEPSPEPCPVGQVTNPQTGECEITPPEPCPVGQVTNPQTGECETSSPTTNVNNNTVPNNTAPIINGNCNAVAISEGVNASSAAAASVTCINQQINNVIKQQRVGQATTNPIVQSDNMKLGQTQIDSNNLLVIADFYPFRIVGGHVSANLPIGNEIQVIIGEIDTTGILSKAVALPLIEARDLTMNDILYSTQLGSVVQGDDIFSNTPVIINSPNIIMLYNNGNDITFSGPNSIAYTAILN